MEWADVTSLEPKKRGWLWTRAGSRLTCQSGRLRPAGVAGASAAVGARGRSPVRNGSRARGRRARGRRAPSNDGDGVSRDGRSRSRSRGDTSRRLGMGGCNYLGKKRGGHLRVTFQAQALPLQRPAKLLAVNVNGLGQARTNAGRSSSMCSAPAGTCWCFFLSKLVTSAHFKPPGAASQPSSRRKGPPKKKKVPHM